MANPLATHLQDTAADLARRDWEHAMWSLTDPLRLYEFVATGCPTSAVNKAVAYLHPDECEAFRAAWRAEAARMRDELLTTGRVTLSSGVPQ